jgi:hypothetical protein
MLLVHEFGHAAAAVLTGADIVKITVYPFTFSKTLVNSNYYPTFVISAGPAVGAFLPLLIFFIAKSLRSPGLYLFRFFAGFSLIVNGAYLAFGPLKDYTDAAAIARAGCPPHILTLIGILIFIPGALMIRGLGSYFGLGPSKGNVSKAAAVTSAALLVVTLALELTLLSPFAN